MLSAWLEILAHGQDIATGNLQVTPSFFNLTDRLAKTKHNPRLRWNMRMGFFDPVQQVEGADILGLRPDLRVKSCHRFDIVIKDVGAGVEDGGECPAIALQVGDEHLHQGVWLMLAYGGYGLSKKRRTTVRQIVTGHRGNHRIAQPKKGHRLGHPLRLCGVRQDIRWVPDRTKPAIAGTLLAEDHKGRRPLAVALKLIRALGLLADGG